MARLLCLLVVIPLCFAVPSNIVRPCEMGDYLCIGENLAANSRCSLQVSKNIPSEYSITAFPFQTPYFNASYVDNNLIIRNHDKCFVSEFFYNVDTDNAVLALRCPQLEFQSTRKLIQHYPEREDVEYSYDYRGIYPEIILTVNLRPANAMDLCNIDVYSYVTSLPNYIINPTDVKTHNFLSRDLSFLNIFEREAADERGNELLRYWVNTMLCNFGCNF